MDWLNAMAGLGVGVMVGLTGVGGGALMTPILVLLFGVAPALAVGTDLWFAAITKLVGGTVHHRTGSVDWQVVRRLCAGSLPASVATLLVLHALGAGAIEHGLIVHGLIVHGLIVHGLIVHGLIVHGLIVHGLGAVLLLTALAMLAKKRLHAVGQALRSHAPAEFKRAQPALTVAAGALLGRLVTLTSVGAGALGAVMLVYLYPFRMKPNRLVGTDIVHAVPLTLVAGSGHLLMGNVDFALLGQLLAGSIPGIVIGSLLAYRTPEAWLRKGIAFVLAAVSLKLLLG